MSENIEKGLSRILSVDFHLYPRDLSTTVTSRIRSGYRAREGRSRERVSSLLVSLKLFCLLNMRRLVFISILAGSPTANRATRRCRRPFLRFAAKRVIFYYFFFRQVSPLTQNVPRINDFPSAGRHPRTRTLI